MPYTVQNTTGDGFNDVLIRTTVEVPDSGSTVVVAGQVDIPGEPSPITITGSPLTIPSLPAAGHTVGWIIQVDPTNGGIATVKSATDSMPTPDSLSQSVTNPITGQVYTQQIVIFQQTLTPTTTDDAFDNSDQTPDDV